MPERRRTFFRTWSGLLILALTAVLGDPHALLAPRAPAAPTGALASMEDRDTVPRRGRGEGRRCGHGPRVHRYRYRYGIVPHPRCHWD
ncbi:hypothetical protein [Nocardiopsis sp. ATB16-24]|uniref:hypothetical protein n=1 Tax=Nocardiopsis sp. ATB16-24 TaxID=3019555 RepID=UPI0025525566|nr:hypothetical protein [Nocardiopsis sp. ATB16-24]